MICVPLTGSRTEEMLAGAARAKALGADLVEFRLDYVAAPDVPQLVARKPLPAIFTCRPTREGGQFDGPEDERIRILQQAVDAGADYVDVELDTAGKIERKPGVKLIVSLHDFERTPDDLDTLYARVAGRPNPDVVKIATTANDITDNLRLFELLRKATLPTIALAMGERGVISRILAPKFGGLLTFASLEEGRGSAAGQLTITELLEVYRYRDIDPDTELFGVVANPVGHSMSPLIHNAAFAACGMNRVYLPFLVDDVTDFLKRFRMLPVMGFSVTIPHKEQALKSADEVDALTERIGALNTLVNRDGRLVGTNTDCSAAIGAMEDALGEQGDPDASASGRDAATPWSPHRGTGIRACHDAAGKSPLAGKRVALIGARGTARAVGVGLVDAGARVKIFNRTVSRARILAAELGCDWASLDELTDASADVIVNTTPVGMYPKVDASIVPVELLRPGVLVFDAVYNPVETRRLREARERGCLTVTGLEMFTRQAAEQFRLFTDTEPPTDLMRRVVEERLMRNND